MRKTTLLALLALLLWPRSAVAAGEAQACIAASEEGQVLRDDAKLIAARTKFLHCAQEHCPGPIRKECFQWLEDVEQRLPTVVLEVRDPKGKDLVHVTVSIDGKLATNKIEGRALRVDPGARRFRFEVAGSRPVEQTVVVREGDKGLRVRATVGVRRAAPVPKPADDTTLTPPRIAALVVAGVGVAALGVAAYFGITGQMDKDELEESCAPTSTCAPADVTVVRDKLIAADVLLAVGIGALGVSAVLFFVPF